MRDHPGVTATLVIVVVLVVAAVVGKLLAERAATGATDERADEVEQILSGATPEDFLAFDAGVRREGSIARRVRDQQDFVNVRARADLSFLRFQPTGWWSGFTERCVVAEVTEAGVRVRVPKTACVRVAVPGG